MVTRIFKRKGLLLGTLGALLVAAACVGIYVGTYYHAGAQAQAALQSDAIVEVTMHPNGNIVFSPKTADRGLIFYPGGKVEHTAYAPLMHALAGRGWHCVLEEMPLRLAVLDTDAAEGIPEQFPEIDSWYIGGHSLGGAMAASYAAEHTKLFDGLILLASYTTEDIRQSGLNTYTLYGSEDKVLDLKKHETYSKNLPVDTHALVIDGGCHAYFGDYGNQDGDGIPAISVMDQIQLTVDFLAPES